MHNYKNLADVLPPNQSDYRVTGLPPTKAMLEKAAAHLNRKGAILTCDQALLFPSSTIQPVPDATATDAGLYLTATTVLHDESHGLGPALPQWSLQNLTSQGIGNHRERH